jgi:hypothetical protein
MLRYKGMMRDMKSLVEEARTLATIINTSRFLGEIPSADITVRLTEVVDLMESVLDLEKLNVKQTMVVDVINMAMREEN